MGSRVTDELGGGHEPLLPPLLDWLLSPEDTELLEDDAAAEDEVAAGVGVAAAVLVDEVAAEELAAEDEVLVVPALCVEAALSEALSAAVELAACCANSPSPTALVATTAPTASLTLDINPMLFMAQLCDRALARRFESPVQIL